jgi:hypothetical protein
VCQRPDRAEIDRSLAAELVNLSKLARDLGVGRKALERHRDRHVPPHLDRLLAEADIEVPSPLVDELTRRYGLALEALAAAQSGVLAHVDPAGHPGQAPSHAAVAARIDDARHHVDAIAGLLLDAVDAGQLVEPIDPQLRERVRQVLERHLRTAADAPTADV